MSKALNHFLAAVIGVAALTSASAQDLPTHPSKEAATVFTRARLQSVFQEADGKLYVRLKLLPGAKIPFTTQTFRLPDRSLLAEIPEGSPVKFTSKQVDGENTVTAIHMAPDCKRFEKCD
ncbi:copper-binding protein [Variovorax sp. J22R133]|uniref:copper-binding protein n=1 Tax=Variovorax brevis TaxID=3053503 RepID=UPI0025767A0A|nr:copper-binding protein [Variovorax sp. J22R133]MDM0112810.1 copper-binding protein [Variovorax sp. J22R133]